MYWKSPGDPVTDYVIYYQSKGGPVISDRVSGGETETHSLDGLQRGVTYYISIVALSPHLPSPLVGPVSVVGELLSYPYGFNKHSLLQGPLLLVEISNKTLNTSQLLLNCTAKAIIDGINHKVEIDWAHTNKMCEVPSYSCALTVNATVNTTFHCTARYELFSQFKEVSVLSESK